MNSFNYTQWPLTGYGAAREPRLPGDLWTAWISAGGQNDAVICHARTGQDVLALRTHLLGTEKVKFLLDALDTIEREQRTAADADRTSSLIGQIKSDFVHRFGGPLSETNKKRAQQRKLLTSIGFTVQTQGPTSWWALLPGETTFIQADNGKANYLGFFSSEDDLLEEISIEIARGTYKAWEPIFSKWRHGGWYVHNIRYPSGACGCVSNNYVDKKWRIVCDHRRIDLGKPGDFTFATRVAAAVAELELVKGLFAKKKGSEQAQVA